ncbi:M23 family metallopeptidase [Gallionella capsiferriformans]|uniref:Peptidase M23 n=1 Tax=Gallionella capsiferriformans (strain ES-2) TaxID=395494 RepID=D9SJN9_GALCS|nr:M23 family metallopeptidase [Gallionella capsiferriformans]ADL54388.1 Peptidase M23 [Gallionella capsiferriformans ES-2]
MNIILVSNRCTQSRSIYLTGWHVFLCIVLLVALTAAAVLGMMRFAPAGLDKVGIRPNQLVYQRSNLSALALKLGEMQARVQRLDALGGRLVKLTGMKPEEFQFDQPPAQGGPLVTAGPLSLATLAQQLETLAHVVDDRSDKLMALQTLLMQNQLSRGLLPSIVPIENGVYTSNFGWRVDPFSGSSAMHEGVDFMAEPGTPIFASAGGVVVYADTHAQYGNMVEIDHGNDIVTRYAHASKLLVKAGQVVRRGDKVAEVGSTGRSTGNHLHFEVRYKGSAQNPVRFLQNAAG